MVDTREAKLPVWAQKELALVRMRRDEMEAKIRAFFPDAPTNTWWLEDFQKERPLPVNAIVRFRLGPKDFDYVDVRIDKKTELLDISGGQPVAIHPHASNHFLVSVVSQE